jgi:hypothetical protein
MQQTNLLDLDAETRLDRILTLKEAATIMNVSIDTIKRNHKGKIIELSPRRRGMRLRHALMKD